MLHVRPTLGLVIPDPERRRPLPEGGAKVPDSEYWRRRIADGDVVVTRAGEDGVTKAGEDGVTKAGEDARAPGQE